MSSNEFFSYHSSDFTSSSFALDAIVFTADDTFVSTALLLLSNFATTASLSDCVDDAAFTMVVVVVVD